MKIVTCTNLDTVRIELLGEARALNIPAAALLRMRDTQAELLALCKEAEHLMPYIPAENFDGHAAGFFRRVAEVIKKAEGAA